MNINPTTSVKRLIALLLALLLQGVIATPAQAGCNGCLPQLPENPIDSIGGIKAPLSPEEPRYAGELLKFKKQCTANGGAIIRNKPSKEYPALYYCSSRKVKHQGERQKVKLSDTTN